MNGTLPDTAFIRLVHIVGNAKADPPIPALIPISKSTLWNWVKSGRFPRPVKLGPRVTAWRVSELRDLIDNLPV